MLCFSYDGNANDFGFSLTGDLGKYFGVPLQHKRASLRFYSHVTEKMLQRLSARKANGG